MQSKFFAVKAAVCHIDKCITKNYQTCARHDFPVYREMKVTENKVVEVSVSKFKFFCKCNKFMGIRQLNQCVCCRRPAM